MARGLGLEEALPRKARTARRAAAVAARAAVCRRRHAVAAQMRARASTVARVEPGEEEAALEGRAPLLDGCSGGAVAGPAPRGRKVRERAREKNKAALEARLANLN